MLWYAGVLLDVLRGRIQVLRDDEHRDLGASALEWAIIAAVSVVMATLIGAVIYNFVRGKADKVNSCAQTAVTASCAP